jgi:hypothetical protein
MNLTSLNPYALQIKIAAIILLVVALFGTGIWIRGVFAERDDLKKTKALAEATTKMYADAWNRNARMQKEIVDAVKKIRVQSNNYIEAVESAPSPAVPDGGAVVLVAPGVPAAVPDLSGFADYSAGRTGPATAGG